MAIAPITLGDEFARAKMNEAIAKANLVDGKADASALAAETAARQVAVATEAAARTTGLATEAAARTTSLATEAAARTAGLAAEAAARRADIVALPLPMPVQHRPGDSPLLFGRSLADGEPELIPPLPGTFLRFDEAGKTVRFTGDDMVAPRHLYAIEPGRRYLATFAVQRRVNSPDPDNDAIRCALAWYGQGKGRLLATPQTVAQDLLGLTTGSGRQVVRAVVSRAAGAGIDIVAPPGARYVRPYVQFYGTLVQNDVEVIDWADITDAQAFAPDVSALEARVAAVENLDLGDRMSEAEAQLTAPNAFRFSTVGDLVAGSVPVIVDAIELLGYAAPGDGGGHRRRRVVVANDATVVDDDGYLWEIAEPEVSPEMLGGNLQLSLDAAAAIGAKWRGAPKIYNFSSLAIPSDIDLSTNGAIFRRVGAVTPTMSVVTIGHRVCADRLSFEFDGTEAGSDPTAALIRAGDNLTCGWIKLKATVALGYDQSINGVVTTGVATSIGWLFTDNIDYPLMLDNQSPTDLAVGSVIGPIIARSYLRPLYAKFCSFRQAGILARGRSPNAASISAPGRYISVLLEGVESTSIGNLHMEECGHGVRIGGSPHANARAQDITFGDIYVTKTRGCAFKVDPSRLVSPGVTEKARRITAGNITGVDVGDGVSEGNREFIRISHGEKVAIGHARALVRDRSFSGQAGIGLNDVDGFSAASLHGDAFATVFFHFVASQDVDGVDFFAGPVKNIDIGPVSGKALSTALLVVSSAPFYTMQYDAVHIRLDGPKFGTGSSSDTRLFDCNGAAPVFGGTYFRMVGDVTTQFAPVTLDMPVNASPTNFVIDVWWNSRRFFGLPTNPRFLAGMEIQGAGLDLGAIPASGLFGTMLLGAQGATAADLAYGGSLIFGRPGGVRRGAFIGAQQMGTSTQIGLVFGTGFGAAGEDNLARAAGLWPNGDFETFTAGRGLIVKSPDGTKRARIGIDDAGNLIRTLL